jgi:hypothetical protein
MKLIWHIIRKDIVQFRWALLAWASLYAGQIGLGLSMLHMDHPNLEEAAWLQWGNWLLVFLQSATGYLLVTQFVQADGLAGTRMFWLTRPISARRLLAAKALGVLLVFAVLPVLLLLPWWLYCGFGARDLGWTACETFGWQALMIAPAFCIAALTDEISRVLMWTLLLLAGLVAWTIWVQSGLKMALGGPAPSGNSGLMFSRLWLATAILVGGSMIIAGHQFLTRRFVRSVTMTVPMLGLIVLVGRFWPWDCSILLTDLSQPEPPPLAAAESFGGVKLALGPAQIRFRDTGIANPEPRTTILQALQVDGMPEDLLITGRAAQSWHWSDGTVDARQSIYFDSWSDRALRKTFALPKPQDDPETIHWQQEWRAKANADRVARGLAPLPSRPRLADTGAILGYTRLSDSLLARIQARPPASELLVEAEIRRLQIALELPLKPGAVGAGDSQTFRITSLFQPRRSENATLRLVLTDPALRSNGLWGVKAIDPANRDRLPEKVLAVNRRAGDVGGVLLHYDDGGEPVTARIGGVKIRWTICGVSSSRVVRDAQWVSRYPDWLEHTTLVLVDTKPVARITRKVRTEKFEFEPDTPGLTKPDKSF